MRRGKITKRDLIQFEKKLVYLFKRGAIDCPIHLCGGNESVLIDIFKRINADDYVFSTHRNHYHYLLHTGNFDELLDEILGRCGGALCNGQSRSMHTIDVKHKFYSSAIVAGCVSIACGVGLALKMKRSKQHVYCFIGDGACDSGFTTEAIRYATSNDLPITYIIEDNDRSVATSKKQRWGTGDIQLDVMNGPNVIYYKYKAKYPHVGVSKWVTF